MSKIAIVIFDKFTDIDLFLMWDLLNRVRIADWEVKILGEKSVHLSATAWLDAAFEIEDALGEKVDLVTENGLSPYIRENLLKDLQVIYE